MGPTLRGCQDRREDSHANRSLIFEDTRGWELPSHGCSGVSPFGVVVDHTPMASAPPAREAVTSAAAAVRTGARWVSTRVPSAAKLFSASGFRNVLPRP